MVVGDSCPHCGFINRAGGRFCANCGAPRASPDSRAPTGPVYSALRFQIDPVSPPPRVDGRFVMVVVGIALVILAILLLILSAVITSAVSAGSPGCGGASCPTVDPGPWFAWAGLPVLGVGIFLLAAGVRWGLRPA
jgi:hypothetical protein